MKEREVEPLHLTRVGVICSDRLSDGLMMMVASHRLLSEGSEVVTFHPRLQELQNWFGDHKFQFRPRLREALDRLSHFDLLIFQYDASSYLKELIRLFEKSEKGPACSIFYPTYSKYTHPPLSPFDRVFNKHLPMVDNIALAIASLLQTCEHSKNNGLLPPRHLAHRKHKKRVTILPSPWARKKYDKIALAVEKSGYEAHLIAPHNLSHGASLIFESGYVIAPECDLCHLASNLQIPTLVVSGNKKPLNLWRPGWYRSAFIVRPKLIPKALERFVMPRRVMKAFQLLTSREYI